MTTMKRTALVAASTFFVSATIGLLLIAGEITLRAVDGYKLLSWTLVRTGSPTESFEPGKMAQKYAEKIPLANGMKAEWFDLSPPAPVRGEMSAALAEANRRYSKAGLATETAHVFNSRFARSNLCIKAPFDKFPGFIFVYDAPNGVDRPRFRFPRDVVTPTGLVTNNFGWRGPQIDLRKPAKTIRLAFVGGSTTLNYHKYPFSYPELVGFWLNMWLKQVGPDLTIETINAAREAVDHNDVAAIVRDEVAPLQPDIVVFDGATQDFTPVEYVDEVSAEPKAPAESVPRNWFSDHSALGRRLTSGFAEAHASIDEPRKPSYRFRWPAGLDEQDPPLTHPNLPNDLSAFLRNLDLTRAGLERTGGELMLSSFFLFAFDGMKLNPYTLLYNQLNRDRYPYRYADLQRMVAFQNRALRKYAQAHGLEFLDFAEQIPHDPGLYGDAVHALYDGVRLQAWIVAQQLAPLIQSRLSRGQLPHEMRSDAFEHPAFPGNERTVTFDCSQHVTAGNLLGNLELGEGVSVIPPAVAEFRETLNLKAGTEAPIGRYLLTIPTASRGYPEQDLVLQVELLAASGNITVGVLSRDEKRFLALLPVEASPQHKKLQIPFFSSDGKIGPVVISKGSVQATSVEITAASIWSRAWSDGFVKEYAKGLSVPPPQQQ